jgi:ABC-type polar amino acid transport system ATPase subunit
MIHIEGVAKRFGSNTILDGIDLRIAPGEVVSILGPSGSGKSTLIRCINGLEKLDGGSISVDGHRVDDPKQLQLARRCSGTVFQLFNLYPHMTALQNVTLAPIEVLKTPRAQAEQEGRELLASVGLGARADTYPAQLSGGQRQRVGICRALAMKPRYLLLDEVTSALDPEMTGEVLDILARLARSGTTMLFVTHEIAFAREISDRIVFLDGGRLLADLPAAQFFAADGGLAQPRIAQFLSKMSK